jgi:hypothetical protein
MGHALMENRNGLVVGAHLTRASGTAEREAAVHMINRQSPGRRAKHASGMQRRITLGADKGYDAASFVEDLRDMAVTPHVARNDTITKTGKRRRSAVDGRTTRHAGYGVSLRVRKRIEEAFGWVKTVAGLDQTKLRGTERVAFQFTFSMAAYNLIRMPRLLAEA